MSPRITIDSREFHAAMREYVVKSRRELADALNRRLFFILVRLYAILPPSNPNSQRSRIRDYMNHVIAERQYTTATGKIKNRAKSRQLRRVDLIANAKAGGKLWAGKDRLAGADAQKEASAKLRRRAIGSVGYLKSCVVKALQNINGHFTQFGGTKKVKGKGAVNISANAALLKIASDYGAGGGNVGMHKGSRGKGYMARPGVNPTAAFDLGLGLAEGQEGRVTSIYTSAMNRAIADETAEIVRHLAEKAQSVADEHNAKR